MEFLEASAFTRHLPRYLSDDDYKDLQSRLAANPDAGDLIPGTGGFRKARWADVRRGKGRRGGLRIIYYHFASDSQIWFVALYDKSEAADLTPSQKRAMKAAIDAELRMRALRRVIAPRRSRRVH